MEIILDIQIPFTLITMMYWVLIEMLLMVILIFSDLKWYDVLDYTEW